MSKNDTLSKKKTPVVEQKKLWFVPQAGFELGTVLSFYRVSQLWGDIYVHWYTIISIENANTG